MQVKYNLHYPKEENYVHLTRANKSVVEKSGLQAAFVTSSNSTCRYHICQHYKTYSKKCKEAGLPEHHWAIPREIWNEMELKKAGKSTGRQQRIDGLFGEVVAPKEFSWEGILDVVTKFVACKDQVGNCQVQEPFPQADVVEVSCCCRQSQLPQLPSSNAAKDKSQGDSHYVRHQDLHP